MHPVCYRPTQRVRPHSLTQKSIIQDTNVQTRLYTDKVLLLLLGRSALLRRRGGGCCCCSRSCHSGGLPAPNMEERDRQACSTQPTGAVRAHYPECKAHCNTPWTGKQVCACLGQCAVQASGSARQSPLQLICIHLLLQLRQVSLDVRGLAAFGVSACMQTYTRVKSPRVSLPYCKGCLKLSSAQWRLCEMRQRYLVRAVLHARSAHG